jgi:hypothetical protein
MSSDPPSTDPAAPANSPINLARRGQRTALRLGVGLLTAVSATALLMSGYEKIRDRADRVQ